MGASLDSREVHVPGTEVRPGSVRLTAPGPAVLVWPALQLLVFLVLFAVGAAGDRTGLTVGALAAGVVPLALWLAAFGRRLFAARTGPLDTGTTRRTARVSVAAAVVLPVLVVIAVVVAAATGPDPVDDLFWTGAAAVANTVFLAWCGGWLLRVARASDPRTPAGAVPPLRGLPWLPKSVDFGEAGLRFPKSLPWIALALSVVGITAAVAAVAHWRRVDLGFDQRELAWGVGLTVAGGAWLPFLRRALGRGLRPAQIQAIGWVYLVGGLATVALFTAASWATLTAPLIGFISAILVAVPGLRLIGFGRAYGRAVRPAAPTVAASSMPPSGWQDGEADRSGS